MATLNYVNTSHNDRQAIAAMEADTYTGIRQVLDFLTRERLSGDPSPLKFLNYGSIDVTSVGRSYTPDYASYSQVAAELKICEDEVAQKFFNRDTKMVSQNEWIYKDVINSSNLPALDNPDFKRYSPHLWIPGRAYGCGIDLRVSNFTQSQIQSIVSELKKNYEYKGKEPWMFIYVHAITGNAPHIHIHDRILYNQIKDDLQEAVDTAAGYAKASQIKSSDKPCQPISKQVIGRSAPLGLDACKYLATTDQAETKELEAGSNTPNVVEAVDTRTLMPSEVQEDGLMEVLRIGDTNFYVCPVTQVSYSQSMQYVRFSTLRTVGDPKIASDTVPNNITLNIIFPNAAAINDQLAGLVAQFMVTPITVVQNRFIARTLKSLMVDHKNSMTENEFKTADDESVWMIMTDLNIRSIPNFPEAYEAFITLEMFEDRVFGSQLRFLQTKADLIEKYRRKQHVIGGQYIMPSEKSMLSATMSHVAGTINVTADPSSSKLYRDFYKSVQDKFTTYEPSQYNGKFVVMYNARDMSREAMRKAKLKLEDASNQSLLETVKILEQTGNNFRMYLTGKGLNYIPGADIRRLANHTVESTVGLLQMAVENAEVTKKWHEFRYMGVDIGLKLSELNKDMPSFVDGVVKDLKLDNATKEVLTSLMSLAMKSIGSMRAFSDALPSIGKGDETGAALRSKLGAESVSSGLIGAMETLIGKKLFNLDEVTEKLDPTLVEAGLDRYKKLQQAISSLTKLCLYDTTTGEVISLDDDGLPKYPNTYREASITDGINSLTTGISFAISNKIVPQQIIGWRQPTYQHLGRSDWSINMNIVCKGDEPVRQIMYVLNKTGMLSKQIQFTSPTKYVNLDTSLNIIDGDPIFKTLGINRVVLNTVEVSSVPNQPNTYQIALGLEQADLEIRDMERIGSLGTKRVHELAKSPIINQIVPVLKAMVIRKDHPEYGRFLNFEKIKDVVENPLLIPFWQGYGLVDQDGNSLYDYMDKYNFFKIVIQQKAIGDPIKNWDRLVVSCFPKVMDDLPTENINEIKKQAEALSKANPQYSKAFNDLVNLIRIQSLSHLEWPGGFVKSPDQLALSVENYFEGIALLVNSTLNSIKEKQENLKSTGILKAIPFFGAGLGLEIGAGLLLVSNPIGWSILILSAAAMISVGINYGLNKTSSVIKEKLPGILPPVFQMVVNNKLIDIAKEFIADEASLQMFSSDFLIGKDSLTGENITLQKQINQLKEAMAAAMDGCYNDFEDQISTVSQATGIPTAILDPAFYLYADDVITTDLVRELQTDVQNQMSLLVTRANVNAIQLGNALDKDINKPYTPEAPKSKLITKEDLEWVVRLKRRIVEINQTAFKNPTKENIQKAYELQNDTEGARDVFFDKYWDDQIIQARKEAFMEAAFARIQLINTALRFDAVKNAFEEATRRVLSKMTEIKAAENENSNDIQQSLKEYKILFVDKDDLGGKKTWYEAIIDAGGIEFPYKSSDSVNALFKKNSKYKTDMHLYFKSKDIRGLLNQIDVIARCKKAVDNPVSAQMMAQYNALSGDPRMLEKRVDEIQTMQDLLYKATIVDNTGNPIRIFPTFKIYFIEEDAPEWGIYNDFYDYSAVQEITVVKDRKAASDTCVIKLSNVAGKLTDTFAENIPEYGTTNMPITTMMLKPGMSILVKMGYSNSQVELPVVFYGIIIEVAPGPVVEIICQGYGAELNEVIAPNEGVHHGVFGDVKALGDVATWALQQAAGLNHFGKLGNADIGIRDALRLSGTSTSGLQGKMKFVSFITGIPGLNINDPRDDNVFLPYNTDNLSDKEFTSNPDAGLEWVLNKLKTHGNINFDWYVRDQSIWDVIKETVYFSPDFVCAVLPYNDNVFPFIPKIRNTLYVGPRRGYYKYTDMYSVISKDLPLDFAQADQVEKLLYDIFLSGTRKSDKLSIIRYTAYDQDKINELKTILDDSSDIGKIFKKALFVYFGFDPSAASSIEMFGIKQSQEEAKLQRLSYEYIRRFTNFEELNAATEEPSTLKDKLKSTNRSLRSCINKFVREDVGLNSLYYNLYGNNHQYKKLQTHHMATSYTNIINNNIIASADGWANQIKLVCPSDPTSYTSKEDMAISERADLVTTQVSLDDDIFDDQIRSKEVFINNIDPSMWDDSIWAKKIFKGEGTWTTVNTKKNQYARFDGAGKISVKGMKDAKDDEELKSKNGGSVFERETWETLPSRWRVAVSLLAEEVRDMYNGELTIIGNSNIKPYDVVHMIDYTNDMHGSFEVGRVIHSLSPQTGFITRIKPDLIVSQKNRFNADEIFIASKMLQHSQYRSVWQSMEVGGAGGLGIIGLTSLAKGALGAAATKLAGTAAAETAATASTVVGAAGFVGLAALGSYVGYKYVKNHHERIIMMMNNIIGRDSLEIIPLTYRGVPYVAGVEGMKKDSYMRHMYGAVVDDTGKYNLIERMGYMNGPIEFEFYTQVAKDSPLWAFIQQIISPTSNATGWADVGVNGAIDSGKALVNGLGMNRGK